MFLRLLIDLFGLGAQNNSKYMTVDFRRNCESELQGLFAKCTKLDVTLNNFVVRSRPTPQLATC